MCVDSRTHRHPYINTMGTVSSPDIEPDGLLAGDRTVPFPPHTPIPGSHVSLMPMSPAYSASLFANLGGPSNAHLWTYIPRGHIPDQAACDALVADFSQSRDMQHYAITNANGEALGTLAYMSIVPEHRRLEIGCVILGHGLKRTRMATETFYLMLRKAFDELGYQRVEWKANAANAASLSAAERLGFTFEGIFRYGCTRRKKSRAS